MIAALALASLALQSDAGSPRLLDEILACSDAVGDVAKLACYEGVATRVRADRVRRAERNRLAPRAEFGLPAYQANTARSNKSVTNKIDEIDVTIRQVTYGADGRYTLQLQDGAVWRFASEIAGAPKVGDKLHIRRAALGSFMGSVNGRREARIQRQR